MISLEKLSRRAFFDSEKCMPNKMHPFSNYSSTTTPSLTPYPTRPTHPTTTHEFLGPILYKFPPPGWPGIFQDDSNKVLKSIEK